MSDRCEELAASNSMVVHEHAVIHEELATRLVDATSQDDGGVVYDGRICKCGRAIAEEKRAALPRNGGQHGLSRISRGADGGMDPATVGTRVRTFSDARLL